MLAHTADCKCYEAVASEDKSDLLRNLNRCLDCSIKP